MDAWTQTPDFLVDRAIAGLETRTLGLQFSIQRLQQWFNDLNQQLRALQATVQHLQAARLRIDRLEREIRALRWAELHLIQSLAESREGHLQLVQRVAALEVAGL